MSRVDGEILLGVAAALTAMKEAGLADYGTFPTTIDGLERKAEIYAEALMGDEGVDPFEPRITADCVQAAVRTIARESRPDRKPVEFPSAGEFRRRCLDEWYRLYRWAGRELVDPDGCRIVATAIVRRDATKEEVAAALEPRVRQELARGCAEVRQPALPSSESAARLRKTLGIARAEEKS